MDKVRKFLGVEEPPSSLPDTPAGQKNEQRARDKPNSEIPTKLFSFEVDDPGAADDDDDLFDNHIGQLFINPGDIQKQIETQLQEVLRQLEAGVPPTMDGFTAFPSEALKDEEIKGDEFKRLMSSSPTISTSPSLRTLKTNRKLTDDERIMDMIHGTVPAAPESPSMASRKQQIGPYLPPGHPKVEVWTPMPPAAKGAFGFQSVITTTVRRPDGSTETRKVVRDKEGNLTTTVSTTNPKGQKETVVYDGVDMGKPKDVQPERTMDAIAVKIPSLLDLGKHFSINASGYTLPKNLW